MDHRQILEKAAGHTPILRVGPPISRSFRSTPRNCHSTPQFDRSLDIASVIFTRMLSFRVFATHHPGLARTTHAHRPLTPRPHFTPLPNSFACHTSEKRASDKDASPERAPRAEGSQSIRNPCIYHTSEKSPFKPFHCHTSKIIGLKVLCLPHIREKGGCPPSSHFPQLPLGSISFICRVHAALRERTLAHFCATTRLLATLAHFMGGGG
jgi:hypothetical protein